MKCSITERDHQPFPAKGEISKNLTLDQLYQELPSPVEEVLVYYYIIDTIRNRNGRLVQTGSAPNFQGGMITLCTCKHRMRTFLDVEDWKGKWIAGFTGVKAGVGRNALVYLTKVAYAFESHHDLWYSKEISDRTKQAKLASRDRFGDVFEPIRQGDPFNPQIYQTPHKNHSHINDNQWYADIDYVGCSNRRAALLASDINYSFLWDRPLLFFPTQLHRGQRKARLEDFLHQLKMGALS